MFQTNVAKRLMVNEIINKTSKYQNKQQEVEMKRTSLYELFLVMNNSL